MNPNKKIAPRLILKENHPTAVKLAKLCDLADELGIVISFSYQRVLITDRERDRNLPSLYLIDIEESYPFESFPFETEYKLVYENPEYIAEQKREQDERTARRTEEIRLNNERNEALAKEVEDRRAKELEAGERMMLAKLKEKYKDV